MERGHTHVGVCFGYKEHGADSDGKDNDHRKNQRGHGAFRFIDEDVDRLQRRICFVNPSRPGFLTQALGAILFDLLLRPLRCIGELLAVLVTTLGGRGLRHGRPVGSPSQPVCPTPPLLLCPTTACPLHPPTPTLPGATHRSSGPRMHLAALRRQQGRPQPSDGGPRARAARVRVGKSQDGALLGSARRPDSRRSS